MGINPIRKGKHRLQEWDALGGWHRGRWYYICPECQRVLYGFPSRKVAKDWLNRHRKENHQFKPKNWIKLGSV